MNEIANLAGTLRTYLSKNNDDTIVLPVELIEQATEELERQQQEILKVVEDYDNLIEVANKMRLRSRAIEHAAGKAYEYHANIMLDLMNNLGKVLNGEETPL